MTDQHLKRAIWGIGRKMLLFTALYAIVVFTIDRYMHVPLFSVSNFHDVDVFAGLLIIVGVVWLLITGKTIMKAYKSGALYTKGLYSYCRHPLYAGYIVFLIPGIVLLFNSLLMMTVPLFMYVVFRALIRQEEGELIKDFGEEYVVYQKSTNAIFPKLS